MQQCESVARAAQQLSGAGALPRNIQHCLSRAKSAESRARALTQSELALFQANFNRGTLLVSYVNEELIEEDLVQIRFCEFEGTNILFQCEQAPDAKLVLAHTTFQDCRIESSARVSRTTRMRRCLVLAHARVEGCGLVSGPNTSVSTNFANGMQVSPGLGTGERAVLVVAESTLEQLSRVSLDQYRSSSDALQEYKRVANEYALQCTSEFTIINEFAQVENAPELACAYLGRHSRVSSGSVVRNSTLLDNCLVEQNSVVDNALLQRGARVSTQGIVSHSLCCMESVVECQGKLLESILGPKAHLAEGEISSSLIGPLVGFHHQAMLIATFWPRGRGNVAYGANCGSNHTSRSADQSLWPGEGVFFGLGCCVKLPMNLASAAYTIVATGVTCGPGRLNMPFSLVTELASSGKCQVAPGWGIESNAYALERNEMKMRSRTPAGYSTQVFHFELAKQVFYARLALERALRRDALAEMFYDDAANGIHLLGGFALRKDFEKGLRAYTRFLQLFALRGAVRLGITKLLPSHASQNDEDAAQLEMDYAQTGLEEEEERDDDDRGAIEWVLARAAFSEEELGQDCATLLHKRELEFANMVFTSKERDTKRGAAVLPEGRYEEALSLSQDAVIQHARERAAKQY